MACSRRTAGRILRKYTRRADALAERVKSRPALPRRSRHRNDGRTEEPGRVHGGRLAAGRQSPCGKPEGAPFALRNGGDDRLEPAELHPAADDAGYTVSDGSRARTKAHRCRWADRRLPRAAES